MDMPSREDMSVLWMSDMLISNDSPNMMLDTQSDFFTDSPNSLDEVRSRVPLDMVDDFMMLNESDSYCGSSPPLMNSMSTQTNLTRKIRPVKHPGLKLKTPIAYQKDSDPSIIPIEKDGMAICEKCGAIGVKHAFYTKERRFCSLSCAREYADMERQGQPIPKPYPVFNLSEPASHAPQHPVDDPPSPATKPMRPILANTYEWKNQLSEPGFIAAPVSCFKHAPMSDSWDNITVGMKVEVENTDCDDFSESFPDSFWVATVLKIAGYNALLRYEGFGQNCSKDFWVNLCSSSVHPVGWCATRGRPLIPPKTIEDKYKDWKEFLVKRLTGARTLPFNFYTKVSDSLASRFKCGMHLEVVDKNRISRVKVATIKNIVGKRLHVMYYNAEPDDNGFWCHEDSPLIHHVGWAHRVGQALAAPKNYLERCDEGSFLVEDATEEFFVQPKRVSFPSGIEFKKGMKLEAVDPLNLSSICVATVMKVLRENYIMIRIDSYDEDISGSDWFCYHASSPCIFPPGFCHMNSIPLTPPKGYEQSEFDWTTYLQETGTIAAPQTLFNREVPAHGFVVGTRLEAADIMDPRLVCVGTVSRVVGRLLKVHFDGWEEEYDQWLDCDSPDVYPVGWCQLVGHKLEGPRHTPTGGRSAIATANKTLKGIKKKTRRRHKRGGKVSGMVSSSRTSTNVLPRMSKINKPNIIGQFLPEAPVTIKQEVVIKPPCNAVPEIHAPEPEPAPAQEPAGPDQSLPIASEPISATVPPRGRTATSYINTTTNPKLIPRLVDGTGTTEPGDLVPAEWNVFDVGQFLRVNDCAAYCDSFSKKKIDGAKLLLLTKDQIIDLTGMKVGPSLKIFDLIQQLKIKVNPAQERMKASLKKLL